MHRRSLHPTANYFLWKSNFTLFLDDCFIRSKNRSSASRTRGSDGSIPTNILWKGAFFCQEADKIKECIRHTKNKYDSNSCFTSIFIPCIFFVLLKHQFKYIIYEIFNCLAVTIHENIAWQLTDSQAERRTDSGQYKDYVYLKNGFFNKPGID